MPRSAAGKIPLTAAIAYIRRKNMGYYSMPKYFQNMPTVGKAIS